MLDGIKPLLTTRFVKFCAVGASGVLVNLGCLALLADVMLVHVNLAAALAIAISINTNFAVNELWTFRDRRGESGRLGRRWLRFQAVSAVGGVVQWVVFVAANLAFALFMDAAPGDDASGLLEAVLDPVHVGPFKYVSQLLGIGVATLWNFFANFHWTWRRENKGRDDQAPSG